MCVPWQLENMSLFLRSMGQSQVLQEQRSRYVVHAGGGQGRDNTWLDKIFLKFASSSVPPLVLGVSEEGLRTGLGHGRELETWP